MPLDAPISGSLVGRSEDLDRLDRLLGIADTELGGGLVLLSGDAGIGKTRLLMELRARAIKSEWRVLAGHCLDFGDNALPYLPFIELFGRLETESPALADAIAETHPPVTRLMPGRRPGQHADSIDRTDLFEAVHASFERLARSAPLLVAIEDLHWADQSSRDLLSFCFTRRFTGPVSIVASYRSDDLHRRHPLRAATAQWARLPDVARVDLAPLSDGNIRRLVRELHPAPLRESELQTLVDRAEGNAFFTEELVAATALGDGSIPRDLAGLLLVRVDQLDDSARHVVRVASVAGRRVAHDLLATVAGVEDATLDAAVRAAVERHILVPASPDGYAFRHAMLGEAVYDDLLPGERVRLHSAYVGALRSGGASPPAELARHAFAAHDTATALRASIAAGDEAMSVGGPDEALHHYTLALELTADGSRDAALDETTKGDDKIDVVALTVRASTAASAAGIPDRAVLLVQDTLTQESHLTVLQRALLLRTLAVAALYSDLDVDALSATTEALSLVPEQPPTELRAQVMSVHARALFDRGRDEDATRWAEEALAAGRQLRLQDINADAMTTLARLRERGGDPEASRAALEQVVAEAKHNTDTAAELRGLHNLGSIYYEQGRLEEALAVYRTAADRAGEVGRPWAPYGLDARVLSGLVAYVAGDWDLALRCVDITGESPPPMAEALLRSVALVVIAGRGDEAGRGIFDQIRPWWPSDGMIAVLSGGAAIDLFGDAGDLKAATDVHAETVAAVGALWHQPDFQARIRLSGQLLGQLAASAQRSTSTELSALAALGDELRDASDRAVKGFGRRRPPGPEAQAWIARVAAEHLRLRWLTGVDPPGEPDLVQAWDACVAAFEAFPHVFEHARSQARLAAVLRSTGEAARSRDIADAARSTASRLGAKPLLAELRTLGGGPASARQAAHLDEVLTPREQEILVLVARGRSNREIAGQLFISAKTVSVHVSNILGKLGVSRRTEAVAVARQRGLLDE